MTARLAHIFRHPIKGHGREELASVVLSAGASLPFDRHWAVAHAAARLRDEGEWVPCTNFARGAKVPGLMAMTAALDEAALRVTLRHPDLGTHALVPDDPAALPGFLDWVGPLTPPDRPAPTHILRGDVALTDSPWQSVSILSLATNRALGAAMGRDLSIHRWRGNLWVEGAEPFAEFGLIGREIVIGPVRLLVKERITRCAATTVNPDTGRVDADTLGALQTGWGHQDFGVYASVIAGGTIRQGDEVRL